MRTHTLAAVWLVSTLLASANVASAQVREERSGFIIGLGAGVGSVTLRLTERFNGSSISVSDTKYGIATARSQLVATVVTPRPRTKHGD